MIIGDYQQASNDFFLCAGNSPTYLSHIQFNHNKYKHKKNERK